jgi:hypothetical protein
MRSLWSAHIQRLEAPNERVQKEETHSERFVCLLDQHAPDSRDARAELNTLPLADEMWTGAGLKRCG